MDSAVATIYGVHDVEIRNAYDKVIATGRVRLHKPGARPMAFVFGQQVAVSTT